MSLTNYDNQVFIRAVGTPVMLYCEESCVTICWHLKIRIKIEQIKFGQMFPPMRGTALLAHYSHS